MVTNRKKRRPATIWNALQALREGLSLPPLMLRATEKANARVGKLPEGMDVLVIARWDDRTYTFVAELKSRSTPQAFEAAVQTVRGILAERSRNDSELASRDWLPMIVLPYLSDAALQKLDREKLSGIDLSGNGCVIVPGELYVYRSGQRNLYPESPPTKYAYRGATALVPRMFLCRPEYNQVSEIQAEIQKRGGSISLATVSKALKRMESDVLITRRGDIIRLLQPDALLDKLRESYQPPRITARRALALSGTLDEFLTALPADGAAVLSGASSVGRYAIMGRSDRAVVYCRNMANSDEWWKSTARETERFADVELCATDDDWVFFDARRAGAIRYASPVQAYLELATGEQREQQAAEQIRERILTEVTRWTPS